MDENNTTEIPVDAWIKLQGKVMALELMVLAVLQRVPEGEKAMAAAIIMLDRYEQQHVPRRTPEIDAHFKAVRATLEKTANEVIAFKNGDGVEVIQT